MRCLVILALLALYFVKARVTFPYSEVLQAPDIAATNKTIFKCKNTCKAYADRKSDHLMITQNGNIIASFTTIISSIVFEPAGVVLAPGEYMLENRGEADPVFVFYVVDSTAPNYGSLVIVPQETIGVTINRPDRFATVLSSFIDLNFFNINGQYPDGFPRIYSTGFDAAGMWQCYPAYTASSQVSAENSSPTIYSAVMTVDFGYVGDHNISVSKSSSTTPSFGIPSSRVETSSGYVGCSFTAGQNYYSKAVGLHNSFTVHADSLDMTASYSLTKDNPLHVQVNDDIFNLSGSSLIAKSFSSPDGTFKVSVSWTRAAADTGSYALQFDFSDAYPITTTRTPTTTIKVPTSRGITSTTTKAPTTTSPQQQESAGSYCACAVDKFGWQDGWNSQEIWLDVVVVLDTSEAMGADSIADAASLIESLFGFDNYDQLITDPSAPFYTRVGVIAMSDSAEILYNLNMTKGDKLADVRVAKGVKIIDLMDAFEQAQEMFADGLKTAPERATTRQVIYYVTNSNTAVNSAVLDQFKQTGTIVVNHFTKEGAPEMPSLKQLASNGYYFDDMEENYLATIQVFCKANCFCSPDLTPYKGQSTDAALIAAGGCYHARAAGVQFGKAASSCAESRNGLLASVHDDSKGAFLNELLTDTTHKTYYYWIGLSKGDDGQWKWEDNSTDPYTNWDRNEPSSASVAKCAYVDQSNEQLPWGAGNCQLGFPYVCEYAPCSVGNKNC